MIGLLGLWTHALAALLLLTLIARDAMGGVRADRWRPLAALALTSAWAWLAAFRPGEPVTLFAEAARNIGWLGVIHGASRADDARLKGVGLVYAALAAIGGGQMIAALIVKPDQLLTMWSSLQMISGAGSLILFHNIFAQADYASRGPIAARLGGLALLALHDLIAGTLSRMAGAGDVAPLWSGLTALAASVLLALGARDDKAPWSFRLSHAATFQTLPLAAVTIWFALATLAGSIGVAQSSLVGWLLIPLLTAFSIGGIALLLSPIARARARELVANHFFAHRYDYRREWLAFTNRLSGDPTPAAVETRIVAALAGLIDAPGGLLLRYVDGRLALAGSAGWDRLLPRLDRVSTEEAHLFWSQLGNGQAMALGTGGDADIPVELARADLWAAVPLRHGDQVVALVVLSPPLAPRPLDGEDRALLRTAGQQAAAALAEAEGQAALAEARRFEEFNRRFAFILHDIKNLVSQIALLARNAERHADNPEFRADMVTTLTTSANRMTSLISRLTQGERERRLTAEPVALRELIAGLIVARADSWRLRLDGVSGTALADADALGQVLSHLFDNAIDASPVGADVVVTMAQGADHVTISVSDQGCGMDGDFIRTRLFQPFSSTKPGGFGLGAHEARALVEAMGGTISVESAPGAGSRFIIRLPSFAAPGLQAVGA